MKRHALYFLFIITSILLIPAAASVVMADTPWQPRGIGGGGALYSLSYSPHEAGTITMATDMGAVFRSNDGGEFWNALPFTTLMGGINSEIRHTGDPDILYSLHIGDWAHRRQPVRSDDGGQTFLPLAGDPTGAYAFQLFADPDGTERVMMNDWLNVYFSADGGATFNVIQSTDDQVSGMHLAGVFWDQDLIIAATNHGLLVSQNGGQDFSLEPTSGIPADQAIVMFTGARQGFQHRLFAVVWNQSFVWGGINPNAFGAAQAQLYKLDEGAEAWELIHDSSGEDPSHYFLATTRNHIDTIYLGGHQNWKPSVIKTTDGGVTWQPVFLVEGNQNITTGWMGDGGDINWYWAGRALGLAVSPDDPDRAAITDFGFVHLTQDGGQTWDQAYVDPAFENPAGATTPQGGVYSTSGVEQTGADFIHWATPDILIVGFADFAGIRSIDGGESWTSGFATGLPHNETYTIVEHPDGLLYAGTSSVHNLYQSTYLSDAAIEPAYADGHIVTSGDDGASWQLLHDFDLPVVWLVLDANDPETLYASVVHHTEGGIFVTHNLTSGADFTRLPAHPRCEGHPFYLRILDDGTLVSSWSGRIAPDGFFTESSGIFVSEDDGLTWVDRSHANMVRWTKDVVIDPHDPTQNTWFATVFSHWGHWPNEMGGVYRTTDRGFSWEWISDLYRVESLSIDPIVPGSAYASTEIRGLWSTSNLNEAVPLFTLDQSYPFHHPVRLFFNPFDSGEVWSVSYGGGLHVKRRSLVSVPGSVRLVVLEPNWPNPFNPRTEIAFSVPCSQFVRLGVYDARGRYVATLLHGTVIAGRHQVAWDGDDEQGRPVASGVYFAKLQAKDHVGIRKLVLVR